MSHYSYSPDINAENFYNSKNYNSKPYQNKKINDQLLKQQSYNISEQNIQSPYNGYRIKSSSADKIQSEIGKQFKKKTNQIYDEYRPENNNIKAELEKVMNDDKLINHAYYQNELQIKRGSSYRGISQLQKQRVNSFSTDMISNKTPAKNPSNVSIKNCMQQFQKNPHLIVEKQCDFTKKGLTNKSPIQIAQENPNQLSQKIVILSQLIIRLKNLKQINSNQEALKIIQQIETIVFDEVENLKIQNMELIQRLNHQIRTNNQERKKITYFTNLLSNLSSQPQKQDKLYKTRQNLQYLQSQLKRYEIEIQKLAQQNSILKQHIAQKQSYSYKDYNKGQYNNEEPRRTVKPRNKGDFEQQLNDLERRLVRQQHQKQNMLKELHLLKEKYRQGNLTTQNPPMHKSISYSTYEPKHSYSQKNDHIGTRYANFVLQTKRITGP